MIFILSLVIYGSFLLLSILKDQKSTTENLLLTMQQALGFADFFWFWIGWSVLAGVVKFAEFGVRQSEFFFSLRWFKISLSFIMGDQPCFLLGFHPSDSTFNSAYSE